MPGYRWVVTADMIDPDRFAEAALRAPARQRWAMPVALAACALLGLAFKVLFDALGNGSALRPLVVFVAVTGSLLVLRHRGLARAAEQARELGSLDAPLELVADREGISSYGPRTEAYGWNEVKAAVAQGDLVVLLLGRRRHLVIPHAALHPPQPIDEVVGQLQRWIDAAHAPTTS